MSAGQASGRSDRAGLRVALANCAFDPALEDPDALLGRYHSLTGWADALAEAGADAVSVIQRFRRNAFVRRGRVEYHFICDHARSHPPAWFPGSRVARAVDRFGPTAVDVKGMIFPMVVRQLRSRLPRHVALLVRDHGGVPLHSAGFQRWQGRAFYRFGLQAADGFLFTAREQASPWLRAGIIRDPGAVYELPEASTDLSSWPVGTDAEPRLPGRPAILWVGRLDANKDPLTVLDGFALATETLPDAALTLVYGEDDLIAEVQSRVANHPALRTRVHLRGRMERSAMPAMYAGADLFVLGSHREVACFSLIEALSFGVVPVVPDIPPFRVLTDGGRLGGLFPPGDALELARVLERLGGADFPVCRQSVKAHFELELSWAAVARRALEIYRATATTRRGLTTR